MSEPKHSPEPQPTISERIVAQQAYWLHREADMMDAAIRRNGKLVECANELQRENERLRKELDGYKRGRIWTIIASMMAGMSESMNGEKK